MVDAQGESKHTSTEASHCYRNTCSWCNQPTDLSCHDKNKYKQLKHLLVATQNQLVSTKQKLESKELECEKLHFRLQAVTFGDDSTYKRSLDDEWMKARGKLCTQNRVKQAVECNNVHFKANKYNNHHNDPLTTACKFETSCTYASMQGNVDKLASMVVARSQKKVDVASAFQSKDKPSIVTRRIVFADEMIAQRSSRNDDTIHEVVCVDDFEVLPGCSRVSHRSVESQKDDSLAMDIVDKWTRMLGDSLDNEQKQIMKKKKKKKKLNRHTLVNSAPWLHETQKIK